MSWGRKKCFSVSYLPGLGKHRGQSDIKNSDLYKRRKGSIFFQRVQNKRIWEYLNKKRVEPAERKPQNSVETHKGVFENVEGRAACVPGREDWTLETCQHLPR